VRYRQSQAPSLKPQALFLAPLCLCIFAFGCNARGGEGQLFQIRAYDEVYFKNGDAATGLIIQTDNPDEFKLRDPIKLTARIVSNSDVRDTKRRATPESELARLWKENSGRPDMILRVAKEGLSRFEGLVPKIIEMLEKEAGHNADLLALLCELYLQTGQPNPALQTAETLVTTAPGQARSYTLRGQVKMAMGTPENAEKDFDKAFKMAPESQEVVVPYADFLLRSGQPDKANELFANALAKNPKNVAALVGKGMVMLRQGQYPEAEQSLRDALAIDAKHKQALLGMASVKVMTGKFDDAYRLAEEILNLDTRCAEAYGLQAFAKLLAGDKDSLAVFGQKLKDALNEKTNQPRLILASAAALEREAKFQEALNTPEGLTAAKQKRDEAAAKYKEILDTDPPDAFLQYFIGERKFRAGDFAGAETAFLRAAKLAPSYAPVHAAVGAVSLRLSKWDAARDAYAQAIKLDPKVGEYHAGKGLSLLKAQRFEEASPAFNEALSFDRNNVTALCGKGYIANFETNKASAIKFFQQALAADGNCNYAADALAGIYRQEGMSLEYLTFSDNDLPPPWQPRAGGMVKPVVMNGQCVFTGTQGVAAGGKVEIKRDLKVEEFARLEADLEMSPQSPVTFGLRIASGALAATTFEIEFGKDETNEIKVRFKDFGGQPPAWQSLKTEWPADGHVRLGIDTDDLKAGKLRLWVNGEKVADLSVILQKLTRVSVGAFVQVPQKEAVQAAVDNVVLVIRGAQALEKDVPDAIKLTKEEEKKPPEKKAEPDKDKDKNKDKAPQ